MTSGPLIGCGAADNPAFCKRTSDQQSQITAYMGVAFDKNDNGVIAPLQADIMDGGMVFIWQESFR